MRVFTKTTVSKLAGAIKHELLSNEAGVFDIEACGRIPVTTVVRAISLARNYVYEDENSKGPPKFGKDIAVSVGFKDVTSGHVPVGKEDSELDPKVTSLLTFTVGGVMDEFENPI